MRPLFLKSVPCVPLRPTAAPHPYIAMGRFKVAPGDSLTESLGYNCA